MPRVPFPPDAHNVPVMPSVTGGIAGTADVASYQSSKVTLQRLGIPHSWDVLAIFLRWTKQYYPMHANQKPDWDWSVQCVVDSLDNRKSFDAVPFTALAVPEMPPYNAEYLLTGVGAWAE